MTANIQCHPTPVQWLETAPPVEIPVIGGEQGEVIIGEGEEGIAPEE